MTARKFVPNTALRPVTGRFKVGDRVRTQRFHGGPWDEVATVVEVRTYDYVIRYDWRNDDPRRDGDFNVVGRSEANLEAVS